MNLNYRRGVVQATNSDGYTVPKSSYYVVAYPAGAVVRTSDTTSTPTVYAGHGITGPSDACVIRDGALVAGSLTTVTTNSATVVTLGDSLTLVAGDLIFQLGSDGGSGGTPAFDGSAYAIYSDPNSINAVSMSRVQTNANGEYDYFHGSSDLWELVLTSALAVADAIPGVNAGVAGPASSTDNAIARYDGTSGRVLQNYTSAAPTIGDTGAVTIASTLAVTLGTTLSSTLSAGASTLASAAVTGTLAHEGILDHGSVDSFSAGDATPSVAGGYFFQTANSGATTITAFDDGVTGQEIFVLINDANTTIDFTDTTLKGNAGVNWSPGNGDFMRCVFNGTNWYCAITDATA